MRILLILLPSTFFISCKKSNTESTQTKLATSQLAVSNSTVFYIEDFRKPGMDDYQTIKAVCDSVPENSNIFFGNKTYTLSHTPIIEKSLNFYGPATLTRENQITYSLAQPADANSTYIVANSTDGLINLDRIEICTNNNITGATSINVITSISNDTIFLATPIGNTTNGVNSFPSGTKFFKSINFFWVLSSTKYTDMSCSFTDLTFDGNRNNNTGTYYWDINAAITAISKGVTTYDKCTFINSPNETIVGHNADIRNCTFDNLNGSAFHTVADKFYCTESEIHSTLTGNLFENTNQTPTEITGHSEGAITHSQCGGYYTATGNRFVNIGESVLGALEPGISINDWGTSNIHFQKNIISGAGKLISFIDTVDNGQIHSVIIDSNFISNMPSFDWSAEINHYSPGIILSDKDGQ